MLQGIYEVFVSSHCFLFVTLSDTMLHPTGEGCGLKPFLWSWHRFVQLRQIFVFEIPTFFKDVKTLNLVFKNVLMIL